jgi:hypothetical protein
MLWNKTCQQHQLIIDYDQRFTSIPFSQIAESEKPKEKSKNETTRSRRLFGSEVASVFLTKYRCNPFGKVKKQFSIHETYNISAFKTQEKKKADESCFPFLRPSC